MSAVVVNDQVDGQMVGHSPVNGLEEGEELLMAVPTLALRQHFARGHLQGGQQGCRTVTDIVMDDAFHSAQSQWQRCLSSLQCLDLCLLIYAEHDGVVQWIQVQTHNVLHLIHKGGSAETLKWRWRWGCTFNDWNHQ